ncbi:MULTISPECIES: hypothetical protein [Ensifer]|uniref:hypothetical protein n=1 Tax=Ensifer TaxID=106591 RepID=UPI0007613D56|nr:MULTISPECIES: hypothetical protein [Ensifer]MBD9568195.1 hypothetical protein [Ensifer sp. ENS08]MBW0366618.1 hypothetical protein [Ensifer adhaerens]MDF8355094.1 hypothetical protein [Ensifer adhaerens]THA69594.1 hypothetical protein E5176_01015 [Ensifer adhaerens]UCM18436.1 hypothetical protein LDL63_11280 [Ensifer adhaerens]
MTISLRKLAAVLSVTMVIAGPALADSYYQGIDVNNPPGTQNTHKMMTPMKRPSASVDTMSTGSINRMSAPAPAPVYRDRNPYGGYQGGDGDYYQGIVPPTAY